MYIIEITCERRKEEYIYIYICYTCRNLLVDIEEVYVNSRLLKSDF